MSKPNRQGVDTYYGNREELTMRKCKPMGIALAASACLLIAITVAAQQPSREPTTPQDTATQPERMSESASTTDRVYRASQLIGATVSNAQGEKLGQIEDVVIDPVDADVAYAVLSFGGFLGMGEKYFAIPWNALTINTDAEGELDYLVLGVDKDTLQNAPGFDKSNWPNMASLRWGEEIHAYYGQQDEWNRRQAQRQEGRTALESSSMPSTPSGQGDMSLSATVQTIEEDKGLLRLRTAEGESVEFQVPQALAADLQTGDRVEVSIRKREGATPTSSSKESTAPSSKQKN
jgi:sporulation protein YlmC with PRC-barrel domain